MEEKMINAVKNWLESIMPAVVGTLVIALTEDALYEMGKEEGIHGPIAVNLEEFRAPVTAINFYTIVVNDLMMLAATANIKDAHEGYSPDIKFDFLFRIPDFAVSVSVEENVKKLVNRIIEIFKEALE